MRWLVAYISGTLFSVGLVIGGMTQPSKIVGFLDFAGHWDPSLAFVMGGALLVNVLAYRWTHRKEEPVVEQTFHIPTRSTIDWKLVTGGAMFGVGWGLSGYCPGPAVTALPSGAVPALATVGGIVGGVLLYQVFERIVLESDRPDSTAERPELEARPDA